MHIVTDRIWPDEACWGLAEGPLKMPQPDGSTPMRWVQRVFVIRGDAIAKYIIDFGPAERFATVTPLLMPSHGENTVAQLQAHADKNREDRYWYKRRQEMLAGSTLVQDILKQEEALLSAKANRSVVGPFQRAERNAWPGDYAQRALRERLG